MEVIQADVEFQAIELILKKKKKNEAQSQKAVKGGLCGAKAQQAQKVQKEAVVATPSNNSLGVSSRPRGLESNLWHSGVMVQGASALGEKLLQTDNGSTETLGNTATIDLGRTAIVRALFLRVVWPKMGTAPQAAATHVPMRLTLSNCSPCGSTEVLATADACPYGFRVRLPEAVRADQLRLEFATTPTGVEAMDNYKLTASMMVLDIECAW